jgi:membrane glycosyltransferase
LDALTGWRALPDEAPLAMEVQSLASRPAIRHELTSGRTLALRRLFVVGGAVLLAAFATYEMNKVLNGNGVTALGIIVVVLFVSLFAWIALAFTSAVGGFLSILTGGGRGLGIDPDGPLPTLHARTALLMPTYNEDPSRVTAALQAMIEELVAADRAHAFDVFILSDTTDPDVWIAEEAAFLRLRADLGQAGERVFYRRRAKNTERKAGNVAEWVRRFGSAYPHMLTLDADSVMEASVLIRLAAAMEAHPGVGLIQTLPVIVNGTTLFARTQQFAGRIYGPLIAHGITWWHGSEGNYWGHNAIIRTAAFAEQAGLPTLSGRKPFGGHVLSHDFVEAALMRRGGWAIHMVPGLPGSYEESPPSLTDIAIRDRRWCQGNLQHAKILPARGLHWVSRLHMLMGIGSYVTSPLWLIFLLAGILISLQARFVKPEYFGATRRLFPNWPQVDPVLAKWVFVGTILVLLAPKLLAVATTLADRATRRASGGSLRLLASLVVETVIGGLVAPIAMILQTNAVVSILAGRDSGWNAQRRDDGSIPLSEVWRSYRLHTGIGAALAVAAFLVSLPLMLWMLPVLIGLAFAVPLVALTASRAAGLAARRSGLLTIPEEQTVPPVLARANALAVANRARPQATLRSLVDDPALAAAHRAMLASRPAGIDADLLTAMAKLDEATGLDAVQQSLTRSERIAVQSSNRALDRLAALPRS